MLHYSLVNPRNTPFEILAGWLHPVRGGGSGQVLVCQRLYGNGSVHSGIINHECNNARRRDPPPQPVVLLHAAESFTGYYNSL